MSQKYSQGSDEHGPGGISWGHSLSCIRPVAGQGWKSKKASALYLVPLHVADLSLHWYLITHESSLSCFAWDCFPQGEHGSCWFLIGQAWKCHSVVSATFSWSKQVTRPSQIQEQGKQTLDGMESHVCKKGGGVSDSCLSTVYTWLRC